MLLFIHMLCYFRQIFIAFQYISCYCLSRLLCRLHTGCRISIHLMLLFILAYPCADSHHCGISIHLMLLFIRVGFFQILSIIKFQYISCYCLSLSSTLVDRMCMDFNTSHVTVYLYSGYKVKNDIGDFNTSHVTVYPFANLFASTVPAFQYISCYCLSLSDHLTIGKTTYFNTSHVTVYLYYLSPCIPIYLISIHLMLLFIDLFDISPLCSTSISIHLMLLFINIFFPKFFRKLIFQYISCYCLSLVELHIFCNSAYFNTSHVTVYPLPFRIS